MARLPIDRDARQALAGEMRSLKRLYPLRKERLAFLYDMLSILDAKASSLMAFNAIGLAALAVWLEGLPLNWLHLMLDIVFILFLCSAVSCFFVVRVFWSSTRHLDHAFSQMNVLLQLRDRRTRLYRLSWGLSIVAVLLFAAVSVVHTVGTFLRAAERCGPRCAAFYASEHWGRADAKGTDAGGTSPDGRPPRAMDALVPSAPSSPNTPSR